jgi:hypothetical protein
MTKATLRAKKKLGNPWPMGVAEPPPRPKPPQTGLRGSKPYIASNNGGWPLSAQKKFKIFLKFLINFLLIYIFF